MIPYIKLAVTFTIINEYQYTSVTVTLQSYICELYSSTFFSV